MSRRARRLAVVIRAETGAGVAQVVVDPERASGRLLLLDGIASGYVDFADPEHLGIDYLHRLATALDALVPRGAPAEILHLGGGAFALARRIAATRPGARQEVFEHDPAVVALARDHLRLRPGPALRVTVADAADALEARADASAHVVVGDAFVGTDVPARLLGEPFARTVRRVLRPDGVYLLNVIDTPPPDLSRRAVAAVLAAFGHGVVFGARGVVRGEAAGNVLVAAGSTVSAARLARRLAGGPFACDVRDAEGYVAGR